MGSVVLAQVLDFLQICTIAQHIYYQYIRYYEITVTLIFFITSFVFK